MRTMRTKVLDPRELSTNVENILYVVDGIMSRVEDLTSKLAALCSATLHTYLMNAGRYLFSAKT
jgi:hypothetical protein